MIELQWLSHFLFGIRDDFIKEQNELGCDVKVLITNLFVSSQERKKAICMKQMTFF